MAFDTTNLRDYQVPHAVRLAQALHEPGFPCSWDTSDTGTGKTYAACALVRHYDIPTAVVCPKSLMPTWQRVADYMGVPKGRLVPLNYDIIRTGRTHFGDWSMLPRGTSRMKYFKWNEQINLLIFDEFQRCRGAESLTSRIALGAKLSGVPTIGVSATPGESPMDFRALGYLSGWFEWNMFHNWVQGKNCIKPFGQPKWKFVDKAGRSAVDVMAELHHAMMKRGSRISIEELGDKFPKNVLDTKLYRISEANKIQKLYKQVAETLSQLEERMGSDRDPEHGLTQTLRERQKIELLKVGLMVELAKSEIAQGRSVVIFCNFLFTIQALSDPTKIPTQPTSAFSTIAPSWLLPNQMSAAWDWVFMTCMIDPELRLSIRIGPQWCSIKFWGVSDATVRFPRHSRSFCSWRAPSKKPSLKLSFGRKLNSRPC
jgi:hypothetical protein